MDVNTGLYSMDVNIGLYSHMQTESRVIIAGNGYTE